MCEVQAGKSRRDLDLHVVVVEVEEFSVFEDRYRDEKTLLPTAEEFREMYPTSVSDLYGIPSLAALCRIICIDE